MNEEYNKTFLQAESLEEAQDALQEVYEANPDAVIIVEEEGKECMIEHGKQLNFVPSDVDLHALSEKVENAATEDFVKEYVDGELFETVNADTNGYDFVDMGEAGIWATCNVGASSPEESGLFFQWGDSKGYVDACSEYESDGSEKHYFGWSKYKFGGNENGGQTKYNETDGLTTLELEDDAAHANMGGSWRMPTANDIRKLWDLCIRSNITNYNNSGISGELYKLKTDESKQVFFPNVPLRKESGTDSYYSITIWSSSTANSPYNMAYAYALSYNYWGAYPNNGVFRSCGANVRGFIPATTPTKSPKYLTPDAAEETFATKDELTSRTNSLGNYLNGLNTSLITGLSKKEDSFTPGTGLEMTEDRVLNVTLDNKPFKVVEKLPEQPEKGEEGKLYLVPNHEGKDDNLYDEYLWVEDKWEKVGTAKLDIDLSNYYTKDEVEDRLEEELYEGGVDTNGYDFVDMGEAGIWAACNIGASKPEEYGDYFAWGETQGYPNASGDKNFTWNDYKYGTSATNLTKYNSSDGLMVLETEDDAAHANMAGDWRMPTQTEFQKLYDSCNSEWVADYEGSGVNGVLFKLKNDESKQLFFPAAGSCSVRSLDNLNKIGSYWSASLSTTNKSYGYLFYMSSTNINPNNNNARYYGRSVRGFIPPVPKTPKYLTQQEAKEKQDRLKGLYVSDVSNSGGSINIKQKSYYDGVETQKSIDFKTINGQSLFGQGDIKISGGSGSSIPEQDWDEYTLMVDEHDRAIGLIEKQIGKFSFRAISKDDFGNLETKEPNTLYIITK